MIRMDTQPGDAALKKVASLCATVLRDTDLLGRIGGEEFAVLILEGSAEAYMQVCGEASSKHHNGSVFC